MLCLPLLPLLFNLPEIVLHSDKVFHSLDEVCHQFDLGTPIWLDLNISDFKRHNKTRFTQDSFVESIDFDYLEIQVIEED